MKLLKDILYGVHLTAVSGTTSCDIASVRFDSREVQKGDAFVAIKGTLTDGHKYIDAVVAAGARAIICEELPAKMVDDITYVQVENGNRALYVLLGIQYHRPLFL